MEFDSFYLFSSLIFVLTLLLFIICSLVYFKSKQKEFLFYGLYNLFLCSYIFLKYPLSQIPLSALIYEHKLEVYNYYAQVIYLFFLLLFYMHFIEMPKFFSKKYNMIKQVLMTVLIGFSLLYIFSFFKDIFHLYQKLFLTIYVPIIFLITIYLFPIFFKKNIDKKLGLFNVVGVLSYNIFAYLALFQSFYGSEPNPVKYFYYGILIESLVYITGLTYKINLITQQKSQAQEKVIQKQKELNKIQENHQKELEQKISQREQELLKSRKIVENNKIEFLKRDYLARLNESRLNTVQSQMNSHFIFNALNSIKVYLIQNNKELAIFYLNKFSKLIRSILESSRTEVQSLENELKIVELYVSIENLRFDDAINLTINKPKPIQLKQIKVPSLFLQPFIENAIWHGLAALKTEKQITISLHQTEECLNLILEDNGIGRDLAQMNKNKKTIKRKSLGLKMVKNRFDLFNQKHNCQYQFSFEDLNDQSGRPKGTRVVFKLITEPEPHQ